MYRNGRSTLPFVFWPDTAGRPAAESRNGPGEVDEGAVVDNEPVGVLADDRDLHAIVEDRTRRAPITPERRCGSAGRFADPGGGRTAPKSARQ